MEEETIYTFILTKTDGAYLGWSKAKEEKPAGDGMQWIEWNKPLSDEVLQAEPGKVVYKDGELEVVK